MKFRYARHTNNLREIVNFYTNIIGLEILGSFKNHNDYNGFFLGIKDMNWHLEFTESNEKANHIADEDDLIVFYFNSKKEIDLILQKAKKAGYYTSKSKNPYWQLNGVEIKDPDNFGIILTLNKE